MDIIGLPRIVVIMQPDNLNVRLREDLARRGLQQAEAGGDIARASEVRRLRSDGNGM